MNLKLSSICSFIVCLLISVLNSNAHDIIFCGERIPVHNDFVAQKLMNVIRYQIPNVNLPQLRKRVQANFPRVEYYLRATGLPEDLKYLAIVESGFENVTSSVGARGFWQLMPETAKELGLTVSSSLDERDNLDKSTYAACRHLAYYYLEIKKKFGIYSWVLAVAAYNFGIGNISKAIQRQGKDYFTMHLNQETALYVYKIIAVKELFEYPELYMKDFGYNVFSVIQFNSDTKKNISSTDSSVFNSMVVNVSQNDGKHPDNVIVKEPSKQLVTEENTEIKSDGNNFRYLPASITGRYKNFQDGNLIAIELLENLEVGGSFSRKGNMLKGKGWFIGDRIYIDLGFGTHDVMLLDVNGQKGISQKALKNNEPVLLKVKNGSD